MDFEIYCKLYNYLFTYTIPKVMIFFSNLKRTLSNILDIRLFAIVLMVRTLRIELRLKVFQTFVPTTYTRFANLTRTFSYISI